VKNAKLDDFENRETKPCKGLIVTSSFTKTYPKAVKHHRSGTFVNDKATIRFHANHVKSRVSDTERRFTILIAVKDGIEYTRRWKGYYGKKTISRLANIFIEELFGVVD